MNKLLSKTLLPSFVFMGTVLFAQTRVFKEVEGDIKTELKTIRQDNQLVGYLAFTRLEKASEDSINYRITIMDENLNDLGVINFKDISLKLESVSYESDIICVAYTRNPVALEVPKIKREDFDFIVQKQKKDIGIFFQFITLEGKIDNKLMIPEEIAKFSGAMFKSKKGYVETALKKILQLQNIKDKGFVAYYGNGIDADNSLVFFSSTGKKIWNKKLPQFDSYILQSSIAGIHLLAYPKPTILSSDISFPTTELLSYNIENGEVAKPVKLRDAKQSDLHILSFRTNPETGKLNIHGLIKNPDRKYYPLDYRSLAKLPYTGMFSMELNSNDKGGAKTTFSYFSPLINKNTIFDKKGRLAGDKNLLLFDDAYMDADGISYFGTTRVKRKVKIGSIIATVVTLPTILVPPIIAIAGYSKYQQTNGQVVVLQKDGSLSLQEPIETEGSKYWPKFTMITPINDFTLAKGLSGENFYLITGKNSLYVYNAKKEKVERNISLKVGKESINIFPAKEGYFMVQEYNSKEKSTSLSIEAL
jgi:hypothetical protein